MNIRKVLFSTAVLLVLGGWSQTVKVGTFNVRLSSNGSWIADVNTPNAWAARKDGFVKVFKSLDVDVWGLQEVCPDQTAYFEKHLPEWEFVGDYRMADRKSGEASSVAFKKDRFDVIEKGTFWLSETPDIPGSMSWNTAFPRVCSYAFLKDRRTGAKFCFANTHLDHVSGEARKRGIELIVQRMKKIGNGVPIIFTGDHNCTRDAEPAKIARTLLKDAADITEKPDPGPHRTYHNWGDPKRQARIDYIYVSDGIRVLDYATRDDRCPGTDLYPSDHFPIIATLLLPAAVETTPVPRQSMDTWGWWKRCGDVHNHLVKNKGASYDVVFVGDSITHFWERTVDASGNGPYADLGREFKILNLGFAGDRTENVIWRFRCAGQLDGYTAKVFMLMIGTNNFNSTPCKPEDVKDGIVEIIKEIRAKHPESKILLLPVFVHGKAGSKPSAASRYMVLNEKFLPGLTDGKTVFYQDINREFLTPEGTIPEGLLCDGLHLTTHGYCIWRDAVLPFFKREK